MPLQVFVCNACSVRFEELVFEGEQVCCPKCSSAKLERQLSTFAVRGERSSPPDLDATPSNGAGPCGSCGDPRGAGACRFDD